MSHYTSIKPRLVDRLAQITDQYYDRSKRGLKHELYVPKTYVVDKRRETTP